MQTIKIKLHLISTVQLIQVSKQKKQQFFGATYSRICSIVICINSIIIVQIIGIKTSLSNVIVMVCITMPNTPEGVKSSTLW